MKQYRIDRDGKRALSFRGEELAGVREEVGTGHFLRLAIYRTAGGRYVCEREWITQWQNERDSSEAIVCDTVAQVQAFFAFGDVSKRLYDAAGIDYSEQVE